MHNAENRLIGYDATHVCVGQINIGDDDSSVVFPLTTPTIDALLRG
jgi:hypothetical protein